MTEAHDDGDESASCQAGPSIPCSGERLNAPLHGHFVDVVHPGPAACTIATTLSAFSTVSRLQPE